MCSIGIMSDENLLNAINISHQCSVHVSHIHHNLDEMCGIILSICSRERSSSRLVETSNQNKCFSSSAHESEKIVLIIRYVNHQ